LSATDMLTTTPHANAALAEADRLMTICNACRYCEGLCAVFPAMETRKIFNDGDLNYLANLCHNCGACYDACQFTPPHEFSVNVPRVLAIARNDSYRAYAWPGAFSGLFSRNGTVVAIIAALSVALFVLGSVALIDPLVLWSVQTGNGAFYRLMPHRTLVILFGGIFSYAIAALAFAAVKFWRDMGEPSSGPTSHGPASLWQAMKDAGRLRYLDGGQGGCVDTELRLQDMRKHYHHATFYGFGLCFLSTTVATGYHYLFGWEAPYAWYDLPVLLGTLGGIGLVVGPTGLLMLKPSRPDYLGDEDRKGMDVAFLWMLLLTALSGLALLILRGTPAMGIVLALHLGFVFAFFATMPYGKFVHGLYRYLALVRYASESRSHVPLAD
jgi:citrate/tricarballylate utilization protein